jgi:hypothetical protein
MNAQELLGLQEAYLGLYGEVLEEGSLADMFDDANKKLMQQDLKRHNERLKRVQNMKKMVASVVGDSPQKPSESSSEPKMTTSQRLNKMKKIIDKELEHDNTNESYDLIISHLLDEGYANTPEEAQVILDNMSEGWKTDILKKAVKTTGKAAKYVAKKGWKAAKPTVKKYVKKAGRFALMTALGVPL